MDLDGTWYSCLVADNGEAFDEAWSKFLFNLDKLLELKSFGGDRLLQVLQAGARYTGCGWTSSRASRVVFELTGVAIVKADMLVYRDIWLFMLSMVAEVDLPSLTLSQEQSEAAFTMLQQFEAGPQGLEEEEDKEDGGIKFPWESQVLKLPKTLSQLWTRAEQGETKIDLKRLLDEFPAFAELPARAPENNLGACGRARADKFFKGRPAEPVACAAAFCPPAPQARRGTAAAAMAIPGRAVLQDIARKKGVGCAWGDQK